MLDWIETARAAGYVERFHTVKTVQTYNIAEHVYNSLILARVIAEAEGLTKEQICTLMDCILVHDAPEVYTGDIPTNVKWENSQLVDQIEEMEHHWKSFNLPEHYIEAEGAIEDNDKLKLIAQVVDRLELLHFSIVERELGNRKMDSVITRIIHSLNTHAALKYKSVYTIFNWLLRKR